LRDVTPASDSAASLRWFFKVDVDECKIRLNEDRIHPGAAGVFRLLLLCLTPT